MRVRRVAVYLICDPRRPVAGAAWALRRSLEETERRQARQIRALEADDDTDGLLLRQVRIRLAELEQERRLVLEKLATLESAAAASTDNEAVDILDCLPILDFELRDAPEEEVRRLFETFRLRVRYDNAARRMRGQVTVDVQDFESLAVAVTHVVRAPNGTRTARVPTRTGPLTAARLVIEADMSLPTGPRR